MRTTDTLKDEQLFATSVEAAWEWAKDCGGIRWFTDGERRYQPQLWSLASVDLLSGEYSSRRAG